MNINNLQILLQEAIDNATDSIDHLLLAKAVQSLNMGQIRTVATFSNLPSAASNEGLLVFVEADGRLYWSTGTDWYSINTAQAGRILSWGYNGFGQLGDGTTATRFSPVSVIGGFTDWCQVSSNRVHTLGLRTNGSAWAWGNNTQRQLGDDSFGSKTSPVSVAGGFTDWVQLSAGESHSVGLRANGTIWTWGFNGAGKLGIDSSSTDDKSVPTLLAGTTYIPESGIEYSVTNITNSLLGAQSLTELITDDINYFEDDDFFELSIPWLITFNGINYDKIYLGTNSYLTFGAGSYSYTPSVTEPEVPKIFIAADDRSAQRIYYGVEGSSPNRTYRIRFEGSTGTSGTLGSPTLLWEAVFYENNTTQFDIQIGTLGDSDGISGPYTALGTKLSSLTNLSQNTGYRFNATQNIIESGVFGINDWRQISSGGNHTFGLRANGTAWAWGCNSNGQLGDGTTVNKSSPISVVGGFTDWCQVSGGCIHSIGVRTNGTAWAWGCNSNGQLGDGTTVNKSSPISVVGGFTNWCQVSAGTYHSLGVRTTGSAWAWGSNVLGRLGDGTSVAKSSPVSVTGGFTDWCQLSAGCAHSLGVRTNGTAWGWGNGGDCRLTVSALSASSPVQLLGGLTSWCQVSASSRSGFGISTLNF